MSINILGHQTDGYRVSTELYEGPLDLLLNLIEKAELDITKLALAKVTDQYLEYMHNLTIKNPEEVSAFLVIAARLLQMKSAALLPRPSILEKTPAEEDDAEALIHQLILYRKFKQLSLFLEQKQTMQHRTYLRLLPPTISFEPRLDLSGVTLDDLVQIAQEVFYSEKALQPLSEVMSTPRITIRERITSILQSLKQNVVVRFSSVLQNRHRIEIVVTFLAMLELVKQNIVSTSQTELFGEIEIQSLVDWDESQDLELEFIE